jgi:murein L,D-transpeptidase YafK
MILRHGRRWFVTSLFIAAGAEFAHSDPSPLPDPLPAPRVVVHKSQRQLMLYSGTRLLRTYRVGLGLNPVPPKQQAGDNATPEGVFRISVKNPNSRYYLSLGLNYPTAVDARRGLRSRLITQRQHDQIVRAFNRQQTPPWDTPLGGEIFIHGRGAGSDWTWGCVALEDPDMRELFRAVPVGTTVEIRP